MKTICLHFQLHHPYHFQTYRFFDVGQYKSYYDDLRIEREILVAANRFYLPTNEFLLKLIHQFKGHFKFSFYISGTSLSQFQTYTPELIKSFRDLADTGMVEFAGGTDSHSIASLADDSDEFLRQIVQHKNRIIQCFGQNPNVFVNSDLLFTDQIVNEIVKAEYSAVFTNGAKKMLHWRSPNYLYFSKNQKDLKVLLRNEVVSNELSKLLEFSDNIKNPNSQKQILNLLNGMKQEETVIVNFLNYMLLGGDDFVSKHRYFKKFISKIISDQNFSFNMPSEILKQYKTVAEIGSYTPVCWKEGFHSSYFPGNSLQKEAIKHLFELQKRVSKIKNQDLKADWQHLQTTDHFHLMDENHPLYSSPEVISGIYKSKYEAFINYMNILEDFRLRLKAEKKNEKQRMQIQKPIRIHKVRRKHLI